MDYMDLHCDTLMFTGTTSQKDQSLVKNTIAAVDLEKLASGHCFLQFFAIFLLDPSYFKYIDCDVMEDEAYIDRLLSHIQQVVQEHPDKLSLVYDYQDILRNRDQGIISGLLTIEDGRVLNNDLAKLDGYYDKGIRLITLLWNHPNCIGWPNSTNPAIMQKGLTEFGKLVVERMNELGMIIDVSHLSDGGFLDVLELSQKPFMASHSNCRALADHPRNLTDDMIVALADKGGIAGLNFAPQFLSYPNPSDESRIEDMVRQLNHMKKIGGENFPAIGTDFDGVEGKFDIEGPHQMPRLFQALESDGWTTQQIEKLAYDNAMNFLEEVL